MLMIVPVVPAAIAVSVMRWAMSTVPITFAIVLFCVVGKLTGNTHSKQHLCKETHLRSWLIPALIADILFVCRNIDFLALAYLLKNIRKLQVQVGHPVVDSAPS